MAKKNRLTHFVLFGGLVLGAVLASPRDAAAALQDFTFINDTPWQIDSVFVRPSGGGYDWSNDALGSDNSDVLPPGNTYDVSFDQAIGCNHDIKVVWHGKGTWEEWDGINLCTVSTVRIWYNFADQQYQESSN